MKNIIAILLIGLTIIISGCVSDKPNENRSEKVNATHQNETNIEYMEKYIQDFIWVEKIDELELNSRPSFSVGQKFVYKTSPTLMDDGYYFEDWFFEIKQIKRINGRDYYMIVRNFTPYISAHPINPVNVKNLGSYIDTWYCDKENGKCIGKNMNPEAEEYLDENMIVTDSSFFAYWMLGLKENLRWNMYSNSSMKIDEGKYLKLNTKYEFEVIRKEKVNNIECFKVKMKYIDADTNKVRYIRNYWIDAERRILIKKEEFEGGIRVYEQNLVKEY